MKYPPMACGSNEIQTAVHPGVRHNGSVDPRLMVEVLLVLAVNVVRNWLPAITRKHAVLIFIQFNNNWLEIHISRHRKKRLQLLKQYSLGSWCVSVRQREREREWDRETHRLAIKDRDRARKKERVGFYRDPTVIKFSKQKHKVMILWQYDSHTTGPKDHLPVTVVHSISKTRCVNHSQLQLDTVLLKHCLVGVHLSTINTKIHTGVPFFIQTDKKDWWMCAI